MLAKWMIIFAILIIIKCIYHFGKIININRKATSNKQKTIQLSGCTQNIVKTRNLVPISVKWTIRVFTTNPTPNIERDIKYILSSSIRLVASHFSMQQIQNYEKRFIEAVITTVSSNLDNNNLELVSINISHIKKGIDERVYTF